MARYDHIVQSAAESLLEDERLRSNLTDAEAKIVLDWALGWLTKQIDAAPDEARAHAIRQGELARVRTIASAVNAMAKRRARLKRADVLKSLSAALPAAQALPREESQRLFEQLAAAWKLRAG